MRNDFDDDVSTTNDALSVVCGWSVLFYALSLSLSLSVCVCVCVCVYVCVIYVCIYITTIRVPSFPLRSFPKGSPCVQQSVAERTPQKSQTYELSRVCVCLVSLSILVRCCCYFFVVAFSALLVLSSLCFLDGFSPTLKRRNVVKVSFSFSRVVVVLLKVHAP